MSTGGDERDRFTEDWFEEPAREPSDAFRDPDAETWLEEEPDEERGPGDRRPLIAAIAVAAALILAGVGIARLLGDDEPAATGTGTTTVPTDTAGTNAGGTLPTTPTEPTVTVPEETTLQAGDEGESVSLLQEALADLGYDIGTPDGVFGPGTEEAVQQFQADTGLDADGIAGPATLAAINEALAAGG